MTDDTIDAVSKAMRRAWQLGQTYRRQADSDSYEQQDKADETQKKFESLVDETRALLSASEAAAPQPSQPVEAGDSALIDCDIDMGRAILAATREVSLDAYADCAHDYVRSDRICTECGEKSAVALDDERAAFAEQLCDELFSNAANTELSSGTRAFANIVALRLSKIIDRNASQGTKE